MSKHAKKGASPSLADAWLDGLGFYRKNVAYDETCLFRAVSEQLYSCQVHHQKCRQQTVDYVNENWEEFEFILPKDKLFKHLNLLENHMVVCGNIEIQMISKVFKRNIIIFKANNQEIEKITQNEFEDTLRLCLMGNDHYDVVYNKDYIQSAGFCQSIAYGLLYEKVFDMKDVLEIVNTMLNTNTFITNNGNNSSRDDQTRRKNSNRYYKSNKNKDVPVESEYKHMLETKITPFAFRVAKSLDPNIYRNIEYDTWIEMRKEMRLGSWYYGDENLIRGTKCLLKSSEGILQCYIQDLEKHKDQCVVYITSLAERRVVKYTDLNPEPDAKPWPLPYRFAARSNTPISLINEVLPSNDLNNNSSNNPRDKKEVIKGQSSKTNRNNKRHQTRSGNRTVPSLTLPIKTDLNDNNIKDFEGSPLHMQKPEQSFNESLNLEPQSSSYQNQPQTSFHQHQSSWIDPIPDHQQLCSETTLYNISQDSLFSTTPEMTQWSIITENQVQETISQPSPVVLLPHTPYQNYYDQQLHHSPLIPITPLPSVPLYQTVYQNAPVTPLIYATAQDGSAGAQEVLVMSPQTADSYSRMYPSGYNPPIDMSFLSPPYVFPTAGTPSGYYGAPIDAQGFVFPTPITPQK